MAKDHEGKVEKTDMWPIHMWPLGGVVKMADDDDDDDDD